MGAQGPGEESAVAGGTASPTESSATAGVGTLALVTAAVTGIVMAITMVGPLLLDLAAEFGVSLGEAGLLAAVTALPWALAAPFAGLLSDRLGRRPMIVLALGGMSVASLAASAAPSFEVLLALRLLAGLFGSFGPPSLLAAIGDLFPPEKRGMAMGWLNMGFGLAAVAGVPLVGAVGGLLGWRWAFALTGLVLLALAILIRLQFPASRPAPTEASLLATYRAVFGAPLLGNVLGSNLLERAIFNAAALYLPSFLMLSYGLSAVEVAPVLALVAVGTVGGNALGGWLGDRLPRAAIFVAAQILAGLVGLALFGLPVGLIASAVGGFLFGLANAASRPAFLALGSGLAPRHRGAVFGLLSVTNQGGIVVGSALGGATIGLGGYPLLALAVLLSGLGAAALALPLAFTPATRK